MRRLPHLGQLLRPTAITDAYGDEAAGPLAPSGSPFPAWLQRVTSTEADGITRTEEVLYTFPATVLHEDDVVEVQGTRFQVQGRPYTAANPRGRVRLVRASLRAVQRGGASLG